MQLLIMRVHMSVQLVPFLQQPAGDSGAKRKEFRSRKERKRSSGQPWLPVFRNIPEGKDKSPAMTDKALPCLWRIPTTTKVTVLIPLLQGMNVSSEGTAGLKQHKLATQAVQQSLQRQHFHCC